jgi:hypothetical protein
MTNAALPATPHNGACHCGAVRVTVPRKPDYVNNCNCTLCTKHAGLWGYYDPAEVNITGDTRTYIRADMPEPAIGTHFCSTCGCTTHWRVLEAFAANHPEMPPQMGVNMRLFEADAVDGVEMRLVDGRAW